MPRTLATLALVAGTLAIPAAALLPAFGASSATAANVFLALLLTALVSGAASLELDR
jgi:hypothetical protein